MNARADKTRENKSQSVANAASEKLRSGESAFQFRNNPPEAEAQRKLQEIANDSPQVQKIAQLQTMAYDYYAGHQSLQEKRSGLSGMLNSGTGEIPGWSMNDAALGPDADRTGAGPIQLNPFGQGGTHDLTPKNPLVVQRVVRRDRQVELNAFRIWRGANAKGGAETIPNYVARYVGTLGGDTLTINVRNALEAYERAKAAEDPFADIGRMIGMGPPEPGLDRLTLGTDANASVTLLEWSQAAPANLWTDGETPMQHVNRYRTFLETQKNEVFTLGAIGNLRDGHPAKVDSAAVTARFRTWVLANPAPAAATTGDGVKNAFLAYMNTQNGELLTSNARTALLGVPVTVQNAAQATGAIGGWRRPNGTETTVQYVAAYRRDRLDNNIVVSTEALAALGALPNLRSGTMDHTTHYPTIARTSDIAIFPSGVRVSRQLNFVPQGDFGARAGAFTALRDRFIAAATAYLSNRFSVRIQSVGGGGAQPGDGDYPIVVAVNHDGGAPFTMNLRGGQHGTSSVGANSGNIYELGLPAEAAVPDATLAHEGAHLVLGAEDEYADALYPARPIPAADHSLMANYYNEGIGQAEIKARHFGELTTKIGQWFPGRTITIV